MERKVAVQRLSKMLGKDFGYEIDNKAPTPEERAAAKEKHPALCAARDAAVKALDNRHRELMQNDAEYQRLRAEAQTARKLVEQNQVPLMSHKITVGHSNKLFFHVKAQGDSWEEIFAKLKKEGVRP